MKTIVPIEVMKKPHSGIIHTAWYGMIIDNVLCKCMTQRLMLHTFTKFIKPIRNKHLYAHAEKVRKWDIVYLN